MWHSNRIREFHLEESEKIWFKIRKYNKKIKKLVNDDKVVELLPDQAIWLLEEDANTEALDIDTTISEKIKYSFEVIEKFKELNSNTLYNPTYIIENIFKEIKLIYSNIIHTKKEDFDEDLQLIKPIYLSTKDIYSLVAIYNISDSLLEYMTLLIALTYTGSQIIVSIDNEADLICTYLEEIQMEIREIFNFLDYLRIKFEDM